MKKLMYYNKIDQQTKQHEICLQIWGIRSRFDTYALATTFQADIVHSLQSLKRLFKVEDMEAVRITDLPYSQHDIALISKKMEAGELELHPLIAARVMQVADGGIGELDGRTQFVDPTLRQIILHYVLDRRDGVRKHKRGFMKPVAVSANGDLPATYRLWEHAIDLKTGQKIWNLKMSQIKQYHLQTILDQLSATNSKMGSNTHAKYLSALSGAWTFALVQGECLQHLHLPRKMSKPAGEFRHTPAYSEERIGLIIPEFYAEDARNRALNAAPKRNAKMRMTHYGPMIHCAIYTGIRRNFIASLHWKEIIEEEGQMFIEKRMKGDKLVKVFVPAPAVIVIKKQMALAEVDPKQGGKGWIFPYEGFHMKGWYNRFKDILVANDWDDSPKPFHSFRSFAATQIFRLCQEVIGQGGYQIVADQLGINESIAKGYVDRAFVKDKTSEVLSGWKDYAPGITNPKEERHLTVVVPGQVRAESS